MLCRDRRRAYAAGGAIPGFSPSCEALLTGQPDIPPEQRWHADALHTGTTTGKPRGVLRPLSAGQPGAVAQLGPLLFYPFDVEPGAGVHLWQEPLYQLSPPPASVPVCLHMGQTLVLMDKWDAETALRLIEEYRVTATHMVPTMFVRLLHLPEKILRQRHPRRALPGRDQAPEAGVVGAGIYECHGATGGGGTLVNPQEWLAHLAPSAALGSASRSRSWMMRTADCLPAKSAPST